MKSKKVFARKYRPKTLDQVKGQAQVVSALQNSILMDRVSNAYLFSGTRGVGKTSVARIFSRSLNCLEVDEGGNPCGNCVHCVEILENRCPDVIEIDGASHNGVDEVRKLQESLSFMPVGVKFKIVIIDEVHMLSKGAFNALLKTVEEPPAHLVFIFATTELHKVPDTIISRCQQIRFRPISRQEVEGLLEDVLKKEGIDYDQGSLRIISDQARGSVRDALSLLDFCVVFSKGSLELALVEKGLGLIEESLMDKVLLCLNDFSDKEGLDRLSELADQMGPKLLSAKEFFASFATRIFKHCMSPGQIEVPQDKLLLWYQILVKDLSALQTDFIDPEIQVKMEFLKLARVNSWLSPPSVQGKGLPKKHEQRQDHLQNHQVQGMQVKKQEQGASAPYKNEESARAEAGSKVAAPRSADGLKWADLLSDYKKKSGTKRDQLVRLSSLTDLGKKDGVCLLGHHESESPELLNMDLDELRLFSLKKGAKLKFKLRPIKKENTVFVEEVSEKGKKKMTEGVGLGSDKGQQSLLKEVQKVFPGSKVEIMNRANRT